VARSPALLVFTCSPCKRALLTNPNPLIGQKPVFRTKPGFFVFQLLPYSTGTRHLTPGTLTLQNTVQYYTVQYFFFFLLILITYFLAFLSIPLLIIRIRKPTSQAFSGRIFLSTGESLRRRFTNTNDEECVYYTSFSLLVAPEA